MVQRSQATAVSVIWRRSEGQENLGEEVGKEEKWGDKQMAVYMSGLYFNANTTLVLWSNIVTFGLWDKTQDSTSTVRLPGSVKLHVDMTGGDKIPLWWLWYISWQRSASTNVGHVELLSPFKVPLICGFWTQWGSYQSWKEASVPRCHSKDREQQSQLESNACLQYLWRCEMLLILFKYHDHPHLMQHLQWLFIHFCITLCKMLKWPCVTIFVIIS